MRKPLIRGLVGIAAFSLPTVICIVGMQLDRTRFRHDPRYVASILVAMISGATGCGRTRRLDHE